MKNLTLLLVLISGLLAGYLIGDYRGKAARETLQQALASGKLLEIERTASTEQLRRELAEIGAQHRQQLETSREKYASDLAAWHFTRISQPGLTRRAMPLREKSGSDCLQAQLPESVVEALNRSLK